MFSKMKQRKARKGFSLVELVVVILIIAILAVAVFAGGSAAIKKSQVSRTTSDLHNFSIAIEAAMNETPSVANMLANDSFDKIVAAVNNNLPADYQLKATAVAANVTDKNLKLTIDSRSPSAATDKASYVIYEATKTDAWDNPYYVIFDCGERHEAGQSDFFITVVSAGPNAQTNVGANIESDDIFLLVQYSDGDVSAVTYNCDGGTLKTPAATYTPSAPVFTEMKGNTYLTTKGTPAGTPALYAGGTNNADGRPLLLPVNF